MFLVAAIASAMFVILYLMFQSNAPLPYQVPVSAPECQPIPARGLPAYFAYSDITESDVDTLWASGPFAIASRNLSDFESPWTSYPFPGFQIQSIEAHPSQANVLVLGVDKPDPSIVVVDLATRQPTRTYSLANWAVKYELTLKSMAVIPASKSSLSSSKSLNAAALVPCSEDFRVLLGDIHGSVYTIAIPATTAQYQACMKSRLHLSDTAAADVQPSKEEEGGNAAELALVDVIPGPRVTVGFLDDTMYKKISGMSYDAATHHVFLVFSQARVIRALNLTSGEISR